MSAAWRVAAAATIVLLALQWPWLVGWRQSAHYLAWSIVLSLPLVPPLISFLRRRPRAPLWAGIVALFYFCLGVADQRVRGGAWAWALIGVSLVIVFAAGWPGIAAKLGKRRAATPPDL